MWSYELTSLGRDMLSKLVQKSYEKDYLTLDNNGNRLFDPVSRFETAFYFCEFAVLCGIKEFTVFKIQNLIGKTIGIIVTNSNIIELNPFSLTKANKTNWNFSQKLYKYLPNLKYNHSFVAKKTSVSRYDDVHYKVRLFNCRKVSYSNGHEKMEIDFIDQFNVKRRAYFDYQFLKNEYPYKIDKEKTKVSQKRFSDFIHLYGFNKSKDFKIEYLTWSEAGIKFGSDSEEGILIIKEFFSLNNLPNSLNL